MGVYYKVVNPVKCEYLDPGYFGEAIKRHGVLRNGVHRSTKVPYYG